MGPAGLAAAVHASSEGLRALVELESIGGQAGSSPRNYLGFSRGFTNRGACAVGSGG